MRLLFLILLAVSVVFCQEDSIEVLIENHNTPKSFFVSEPTTSNWGLGLELFSGYGMLTGELSDNYTNNIPLGIALGLCYKRTELGLRFYAGIGKTESPSYYVNVGLFELNLGYAILDKERFRASPFLGIAAMGISPQQDDIAKRPYLKDYELNYTKTYTTGINFDIKFPAKNRKRSKGSNYGFFRIRYEYSMPQFSERYDNASGDMHSITLGCGGIL